MDALLASLLGFVAMALACRFWSRQKEADYSPGEAPPSVRLAPTPAHRVFVADIMSKDLITLEPEDSAKRAWRKLQENKVKTLPVVKDGYVVGIIALVDFLKHLGLAWHTLPEDLTHRANIVMDQDVATLMSKPVRTVSADMPLAKLAPLLSDTGLRHVPVVDAENRLVGIVTQSDMIAALSHLLSARPSPE